ncbi:MAG: Hpt domain-containing protein, partial [Pseudobdellovibrionaceae bacterium]|nr:Hpt domain-containing protein [Pseudobdellovibrionaceae bacterium]
MSQLENLLSNESKENIFLVRAVSIVGGIVYFSWSFIYRYAVPGAIDPVETRLIISGLCLAIFLATFIRQARRYITHITYTAMFLTTAQLLWITYQNNFNPYYQMGTIILICVTVAFYQSLKSLLLYIIATSALLFIPFFYFDLSILLFLYFGCGTVFLVSAAALFTRLVLANKLQKSRLEIAQTAEKIEAINRDVKSIMQNIQQGIFTIESPDGHTGKESSDYITRIFDMEPKGDFNFIRFFAQSDLTKDHLSQIKSAVASIGDDFLQFELNSHVLPASFTLKASSGERKIIEIDWNPIVKEDNVLQKILVTVRDVTEYRKLVAANEARQEELKHISEIIAINDKKMGSLFESISRLMSSAKGAAQHCGEILDSSSMSKLFRDVHTIKGLARTYDLSSLAECAHHCEDRISELKKRGAFHRNEVIEILRPIEETLGKYADVTVNKLKRSRHNNNQLVMDRRQIMAIVQETRNSATWSADAKTVYL